MLDWQEGTLFAPTTWTELISIARLSKKVTMALVNIVNVTVLDNPSPFLRPFQFEITFECAEDLPQGKFACRASVRAQFYLVSVSV